MNLYVIVVPYDSGRRAYRMGGGPLVLIESGITVALEADGHAVSIITLESVETDATQSSFDLARQIAGHVSAAEQRGAFPIILAGNCIASLGGFAGLESRTALMWMDAHADFNTPASSPSGFLDGMALAIMTGRCMDEQSETIGGFERLDDREIVMVGVRSVDEGEQRAVARVQVVQDSGGVAAALNAVNNDELYLHVDLDCVDPSVLVVNEFATPNGLSRTALMSCVQAAARSKRLCALAITAFDPAADVNHAAPALVLEILRNVLPLVPASDRPVPEPS